MHTADGEMVEVAEIGSMAPDFDNVSGSVLDWLTAQAARSGYRDTPELLAATHRVRGG